MGGRIAGEIAKRVRVKSVRHSASALCGPPPPPSLFRRLQQLWARFRRYIGPTRLFEFYPTLLTIAKSSLRDSEAVP